MSTPSDVMSMAKEARLPACHTTHPKALERFAEVVAEAERKRLHGDIEHFAELVRAEALAQPKIVQVSPLEFMTRVEGREEITGEPIFWAQWPNKENT